MVTVTTDEAWLMSTTPFSVNNQSNETLVSDIPRVSSLARDIRIVVLPIIIFVGTVGNGLSFLVLIRPRMRGTSVYFYLTVLSCMDTLVLYISGFKTWVMDISGFELLRVSEASCKVTTFLILMGLYTSSWLIVLLTVDRCVAVCSPLRAAQICTVRHARRLTVALLLIICLYNLHVFWTFVLTLHNNRIYCTGDPKLKFMAYPFEVFKLASYCFLPFCLVLCMNCAIIYQIRSTRGRPVGQNCARGNNGGSPTSSPERVIYMLLTVSFSWLIMTAPFSLLIFLGNAHTNILAKTFIFLLMYTNHSLNFFLYCLTGRRFRRELLDLFSCSHKPQVMSHVELGSKHTSKSMLTTDERLPLRISTASRSNGPASHF